MWRRVQRLLVLGGVGLFLLGGLASSPGVAQAPSKLSGALQRLIGESRQGGQSAAQAYAHTQGVEIKGADQRVVVVVEGAGDLSGLIRAQGGTVQAKYKGLWQAELPLGQLNALAQAAPVGFVRLPQVALIPSPLAFTARSSSRFRAPSAAQSGPILSEGVSLIGADRLHARGITGRGIKVGVIDLGFAGLDELIARAELPAEVVAWNCQGGPCRTVSPAELSAASGREVHGAAVAEIVHDVAPEAELYLFLIRTEVELGQALVQALDEGVRVINHSVGWFNDGSFYDGQGTSGGYVRTAWQNGMFWVNAAGNFAQSHYEGVFQDQNGDRFHDSEITLELEAGQSILALFTWDDWERAEEDFDLELRGPQTKVVSNNPPDGRLLDERLNFIAPETGTYRLRIEWAGDGPPPADRRLELFVLGPPGMALQPGVPDSSLPAPSNAQEAFAVGAMAVQDWARGTLEPFSSQGPTNDGRTKPDLVAPDCVRTASYAEAPSGPVCGADGLFPGTSAAAPHVVGMAALLLAEDPSRTPQDLKDLLAERAEAVPQLSPHQAGAGKANLIALADLVLGSVAAEPGEVEPGETLRVRAVLQNAGVADSGPFWVVLWRASEEGRTGRELVSLRISNLSPDEEKEVSLAWPVPEDERTGRRTLVVVADPFADVEERDETNNRRELSVRVASPSPPARLEVAPASLSFAAQEGGSNPSSQTLTIKNSGGRPLSWTASEALDWLKLSRTGGTLAGGASAKVTVSVNVSGLSAGLREGQIVIFAPQAEGSPAFVDVTLTVTGRPAPQPSPSSPPAGMVLVPAGSFRMGDSFNEGDSDELPVHEVFVSAFYMDTYEVTKALWDEVAAWAAANGYDIEPGDGGTRTDGTGNAADHPVVFVSWYEAVKWANARSEREGLTPCYYTDSSQTTVYRRGAVDIRNEWVKWSGCGYRLPTEAEWEKAARGGLEGRRYPWGDENPVCVAGARNGARFDDDNRCDDIGTAPVGTYAPNGYGLYDMAGNVWEWVWDWYDLGYYAASPARDPRGPASGSRRVLRGGGWFRYARDIRVAFRGYGGPGDSSSGFGYRAVRPAGQ